ncbi:helix-turn-helix domain-containing protein [Streptomyces violaceoruber]|uniref:Helix-turn-helix transcriptional regulator n=1 Tax=Streptomyces violaceoruber TaxID=1935 RepID=A0ACD4WTT0_STRVN|nr:helix-turn-helix transcriptional regulator [Streptomyces violaceoruber]BDD71728.1 hypothetical protein JCM4020_23480 [Streptomyces coelicolor]
MEHPSPSAPVDVLARRVRQVRSRREITAQQLADRLRDVGVPWDRATVTKLETGRRQNVTLVEWLALARVLDVAPVHLLIEPEVPGPDADDQAALPYDVTPGETVPRYQARAWIRGLANLPGTDLRTFFSEVPAWEWGHRWVLVSKDADPDAPIGDLHKWARAGYGGYGNPDIVGRGHGGEPEEAPER